MNACINVNHYLQILTKKFDSSETKELLGKITHFSSIRQFFIIFKMYSAIRGGDKSNKSKTMKIGPADLEL